MRIEHRNLSWIPISMLLAGILCKARRVEHQQQQICAVKGSSVVFPCSFNVTGTQSVERVQWGHKKSQHFVGVADSNSNRVTLRSKYIGDKHSNCSLQIDQVEQNDAGKYLVRFFTGKKESFGSGKGRPTLNVVDLKISVTKPDRSRTTKEGDSVNLTCTSPCDGSNSLSVFTWFKDGELIHQGSVLFLCNMSTTSSGNYTCSLKTQPGTSSRVINIDVEHAPKNTSVVVRPSMGVYIGNNFTLTCSSRANPPVEKYSWFKKDDNHNDNVVGHQAVLFSVEGGKYFCRATNKYGSQNSSVESIFREIKAPWETRTRDVLIIATVVVLLIVTTVIAVIRLHRKRILAPKVDFDEGVQDTEYVNWLSCDNHQSQGQNHPEEGMELVYATIDFNRKTNTRQQMDSLDTYQNVIYSTVCRHQLLKPSFVEPY